MLTMAQQEPEISEVTKNDEAQALEFTAVMDPLKMINMLIRNTGKRQPDQHYITEFRKYAQDNGQRRGVLVTQLPGRKQSNDHVSILGIDHVVDLMIEHGSAITLKPFHAWTPNLQRD